ncbi:MAG: glucokinase [Gammaproteobacteria bacterium]|nr:glucokinase [Gammaproteobacteria bacterium]
MTATSSQTLLIGDIGGTNARFALASPDRVAFEKPLTLQCADFASSVMAMNHYLDEVAASRPDTVCLAAAGPVIAGSIKITNNHWNLSAAEIRQDLGAKRVKLLNDFEAAAWSIPNIDEALLEAVGQVSQKSLPDGDFSVAIVGPGTGLGTGGLYKRGGQYVPVVGEGGHIGFAPKSKVQIEVLEILRDKFERVCVERLLSGSGIENIYWALHALRGEKRADLSAAEIFRAAEEGSDPVAADATQLFFEILGQVAGDIALVLGAQDGVYLAGGIVKRYPEMLHISGFRNAFESKGHHRSMMERIPTKLITYDEPGLLGAAHCALELSRSG